MIDVETFAIAKKYTDKKVGSSSPSTPSTSNYDDLKNKPSINGKELTGNLSSDEIILSIQNYLKGITYVVSFLFKQKGGNKI